MYIMRNRAKRTICENGIWKKQTTPALSFYSFHGVYGPGHGAFYKDEQGRDCFSFHAENAIDSRDCQIGCCQVRIDEYGSLFFE